MPRIRKEPTHQASSFGFFSNFCGPGGYGFPQHEVDKICQEHDKDYGIIMSLGDNPYLHYNWADAKMQKALKKIGYGKGISEHVLGRISNSIWDFKKAVTSHLTNSQGESTSMKRQRIDSIFKSHKKVSKELEEGEIPEEFLPSKMSQQVAEHINIQQPDVGPITLLPYVRPHYFTAKLPFHVRLDNPYKAYKHSQYAAAALNKFEFCLNGIYNILTITTTPAYTAGVLGVHVKPNGRDLYVKDSAVTTNRFNFDYYKVLGADVKIKFHRYNPNVNDNERERRQYMRYGLVVDALDSTESLNTNPLYWPETPGCNVIDMMPHGESYTSKSESFHYSPNFDRKRVRAKADSTVSTELTLEGWTATGKNPDYIDSLKIFSKELPTAINKDLNGTTIDNYVTQDNFYTADTIGNALCDDFIEITIDYTVQFRESKALTTWDVAPDS